MPSSRIQYAGADDTGTKYRVVEGAHVSLVYVRQSASDYSEIECASCQSACCVHCAALETAIAKAEGR